MGIKNAGELQHNKPNFFILTGGPGSGKTAVLDELARYSYQVVPEVGRAIIQNQQKIGGDAIHTGNKCAFRDLMLEESIADYHRMTRTKKPVFFDRGIPELLAYTTAFCKDTSEPVNNAITRFRYNKVVFIFPPWVEIYKNDRERQQDFKEALQTYQAIKEAYAACGYELIEMPKCDIKGRVDFILRSVTQSILNDLKNEINQLLGFHEGTPRINYGPCGVFAKLFFETWNAKFKNKVHIVFVMTRTREECWHIAIRLPWGELYDGGVGVHTDTFYGDDYIIDDMLEYDLELLEKWSYGIDRSYPKFCPNFDKNIVASIIKDYIEKLNCIIK